MLVCEKVESRGRTTYNEVWLFLVYFHSEFFCLLYAAAVCLSSCIERDTLLYFLCSSLDSTHMHGRRPWWTVSCSFLVICFQFGSSLWKNVCVFIFISCTNPPADTPRTWAFWLVPSHGGAFQYVWGLFSTISIRHITKSEKHCFTISYLVSLNHLMVEQPWWINIFKKSLIGYHFFGSLVEWFRPSSI